MTKKITPIPPLLRKDFPEEKEISLEELKLNAIRGLSNYTLFRKRKEIQKSEPKTLFGLYQKIVLLWWNQKEIDFLKDVQKEIDSLKDAQND